MPKNDESTTTPEQRLWDWLMEMPNPSPSQIVLTSMVKPIAAFFSKWVKVDHSFFLDALRYHMQVDSTTQFRKLTITANHGVENLVLEFSTGIQTSHLYRNKLETYLRDLLEDFQAIQKALTARQHVETNERKTEGESVVLVYKLTSVDLILREEEAEGERPVELFEAILVFEMKTNGHPVTMTLSLDSRGRYSISDPQGD